MLLQFKYRRTYKPTDELNRLPQHNTHLLYPSPSSSLSLWVFDSAHAVTFPFDSTFFIWSRRVYFVFPTLHLCGFVFDILFFPCFRVCHLESVIRLCWLLFVTLLFFLCFVWGETLFPSFFFYLTCTMWLSLFLWCIVISCANKWTLHSRWQCRRSKEY